MTTDTAPRVETPADLAYRVHELLVTATSMIEGALTFAPLSDADREDLTKAAGSVEMADADLCSITTRH